MIEVELPDGRVIEVDTDDPQAAAEAARDYLQQGGEPAAEAVSPEPAQAGFTESAGFRLPVITAQGVNEGLARMAELPYDALNNLPQLLNLLPGEQGMGPISEMAEGVPVLGDLFGSRDPLVETGRNLGFIDVLEPEGFWENTAERAGQEVGASILPAAGMLSRAGTLASRGTRAVNMGLADRAFVAPFMQTPGRTTAAEGLTALAAGGGASAATQYGGEDLDVFGGLAGGMAGAFSLGQLGRVARFGAAALPDNVARQEIGRRLVTEATDPSTLDTAVLRDVLDDAPFDMNLTLGQATNDPGLRNLEYSRLTGPQAGRFSGMQSAQNQILRDVLTEATPTTPDDTALRALFGQMDDEALSRLTRQQQALIDDATGRWAAGEIDLGEAQSLIDDAISAATPGMTGEMASRTAATRVLSDQVDDSIINQYRAPRDELYGAVPDDVAIPTEQARSQAQEIVGRTGRAGQPPAAIARVATDEATELPLGNVRDDLRRLGDEARAAQTAGRPNEARDIRQVQEAVRGDIGTAADADAALRAANRNESLVYAPRFREGVPAQVRAGTVADQDYLARALRDPTEADRLAVTIRGDEQAQAAVRNWLLDDLSKGKANELTAAKVDTWLARNRDVLDRFPEIRDEVQRLRTDLGAGEAGVRRARGTIKQAEADQARATKGLEQAEATVAKTRDEAIAVYSRAETASESMGRVLRGSNSRDNLARLMNLTEGSTEAREGLRRGFADFLQQSVISTNDGAFNPGASADFLRRFGDHIDVLYRDTPQHGADLKRMLESVNVLNRTASARPRGTTGTAVAMRPEVGGIPLTSVFSRIFAAESGRTSYRFVGSEMLAQAMVRLQARLQGPKIGLLLDEALMNPQFAATLAAEHNARTDAQATRLIDAITARLGARGARTAIANGEDEE